MEVVSKMHAKSNGKLLVLETFTWEVTQTMVASAKAIITTGAKAPPVMIKLMWNPVERRRELSVVVMETIVTMMKT